LQAAGSLDEERATQVAQRKAGGVILKLLSGKSLSDVGRYIRFMRDQIQRLSFARSHVARATILGQLDLLHGRKRPTGIVASLKSQECLALAWQRYVISIARSERSAENEGT
jgi:hypothetical protein